MSNSPGFGGGNGPRKLPNITPGNLVRWLLVLSAIVTAVVMLVKHPDTTAATVLTLALVAVCFFMLRKARTGSRVSKKARAAARIGLVIVPLASAAGLFWWLQPPPPPPVDLRLRVVVARFDGPEMALGVTKMILRALRENVEGVYDDIVIVPFRETLTEEDGVEGARDAAEKYQPDILIWGWYTLVEGRVDLSVNFELFGMHDVPDIGSRWHGALRETSSRLVNIELPSELTFMTLYVAGLCRYSHSDWNGSIARLTDALDAAPESITAHNKSRALFFRGRASAKLERWGEMLRDNSQASVLDPGFTNAHYNLGNANIHLGHFGDAINGYSLAIGCKPTYSEAFTNRAYAYAQRGDRRLANSDVEGANSDWDRALEDFGRGAELDDHDALAHRGIGGIYNRKGEFRRAIPALRKAIALRPRFIEAYGDLGNALAQSGKLDEAITAYDHGLKLDPHPSIRVYFQLNRAEALIEKGEIGAAQKSLEQIVEVAENPELVQEAKRMRDELDRKAP